MKHWFGTFSLVVIAALPISSQQPSSSPLSFRLECAGSDCPLLHGAPQTSGMRSGFVRLKPGQSVGEHSTLDHEEALIVLQGEGKAEVEGHAALRISPRMLAYIPPRSRHNVTNTGSGMLEYVYVVAAIPPQLKK